MEFPPASWDVFQGPEFETAGPRDPGELGVELMVQARANGRLLDHFRITLGELAWFLQSLAYPACCTRRRCRTGTWWWLPGLGTSAFCIRRNMATGPWQDLISSNDVRIETPKGIAVDSKLFLDYSDSIADKMVNSASIRWAVCVGGDNRPCLALMALPAPASTFSCKPLFKGYVNNLIINA